MKTAGLPKDLLLFFTTDTYRRTLTATNNNPEDDTI